MIPRGFAPLAAGLATLALAGCALDATLAAAPPAAAALPPAGDAPGLATPLAALTAPPPAAADPGLVGLAGDLTAAEARLETAPAADPAQEAARREVILTADGAKFEPFYISLTRAKGKPVKPLILVSHNMTLLANPPKKKKASALPVRTLYTVPDGVYLMMSGTEALKFHSKHMLVQGGRAFRPNAKAPLERVRLFAPGEQVVFAFNKVPKKYATFHGYLIPIPGFAGPPK